MATDGQENESIFSLVGVRLWSDGSDFMLASVCVSLLRYLLRYVLTWAMRHTVKYPQTFFPVKQARIALLRYELTPMVVRGEKAALTALLEWLLAQQKDTWELLDLVLTNIALIFGLEEVCYLHDVRVSGLNQIRPDGRNEEGSKWHKQAKWNIDTSSCIRVTYRKPSSNVILHGRPSCGLSQC